MVESTAMPRSCSQSRVPSTDPSSTTTTSMSSRMTARLDKSRRVKLNSPQHEDVPTNRREEDACTLPRMLASVAASFQLKHRT